MCFIEHGANKNFLFKEDIKLIWGKGYFPNFKNVPHKERDVMFFAFFAYRVQLIYYELIFNTMSAIKDRYNVSSALFI